MMAYSKVESAESSGSERGKDSWEVVSDWWDGGKHYQRVRFVRRSPQYEKRLMEVDYEVQELEGGGTAYKKIYGSEKDMGPAP